METGFTLADRTYKFSRDLIAFCHSIPKNTLLNPILLQVIRSGTSIGANYCEAEGYESSKDFIHKVMVVKKEAKETLYWLNLLKEAYKIDHQDLPRLIDECDQLIRIFGKISSKKY